MDDVQTQYSFGQQFLTNNCSQCFCGNGGNISCEQLQCESDANGKFKHFHSIHLSSYLLFLCERIKGFNSATYNVYILLKC